MGVATTLFRLIGGIVGERVGSSIGDRIERSFLGSNGDETDEDEEEESDESDEDEEEEADEEEEETDESSEAEPDEDESAGESVAERVTSALDSVAGGSDEDEDESGALGDLDAMSDEDLQELAETLVNELNQRSEE
ncbi:hypothetical protein [Halococcus hamelinensis]|uniref:Uncharacterized protein n=1 Tax=Halococcus hamelinensis 100A6 TaxID=1132509 RepID=M0LTR6_9EURY|nr:hypothetical protein [Halococcus hamelinensis]EMA36523.1 hypothetical protein C447_14736 [Halococcus hamelinensis 100A6]